MEDVLTQREFHVDGTVWAILGSSCDDSDNPSAPTVKWMDVATGSVAKTLELPWKECMYGTPRVFEKDGRIGIISPSALGNVAVVDIKARKLVKHFSLDQCAPTNE
jgi:hypothetical protein